MGEDLHLVFRLDEFTVGKLKKNIKDGETYLMPEWNKRPEQNVPRSQAVRAGVELVENAGYSQA